MYVSLSFYSIWTEFTPLANKHGATNLGQGFPNWPVEPFVTKALEEASKDQSAFQYSRSAGDLKLVQKLAVVYSPLFGRTIDPLKQVLVSNGASGALHTVFNSYLNPGDEVIVIEAFFDLYITGIESCGAKPVFVQLQEPEGEARFDSNNWKIDEADLRAKITNKTKAIVLNNPHNPSGKVFSKQELEMIAQVAQEHDLLVISDEVYEFLVFDRQAKHYRIATLPGMWQRTLTIGSAGKAFSTTGLKIGWIIGPDNLIFNTYLYNQYSVFCTNTLSQRVVAQCFDQKDYFSQVLDRFEQCSNLLQNILERNGLKVVKPHSGYFMLASIENVDFPFDDSSPGAPPRDFQFCRWLPGAVKVAAIPPSAFYSEENKRKIGSRYARFCLCKTEETLQQAAERLDQGIKLKDGQKKPLEQQ